MKTRRIRGSLPASRLRLVAAAACAILLAVVFIAVHMTSQVDAPDPLDPVPGVLETTVATEREDGAPDEGEHAPDVAVGEEEPSVPAIADIPEEDLPEIAAEHESDTVLLQVGEDVSLDELNAALAKADSVQPVTVTEGDLVMGYVEIPLADGVDVSQAMAQLQSIPSVGYVQPNYLYYLTDDIDAADDAEADSNEIPTTLHEVPRESDSTEGQSGNAPSVLTLGSGMETQAELNDPYASQQWMLRSIGAYDAWNQEKVEKKVTVAVMDNGCQVNHEDLKDNIVAAYNAVTGGTVLENREHGTHVCGIVAAKANNGKGVAGVSYDAGVLPIQVFKGDTASSGDIAKAYAYVLSNKDTYRIKVVNMSLGGPVAQATSASDSILDSEDRMLTGAVRQAYDAGILTVCSSGNDANTMGGAYFNYPSDWLDCALGVIALKNTSPPSRDGYSNYNRPGQQTKDISAPGSSIFSTYAGSSNNSYDYMSGTSMASPCVAGVAALVYAVNPNLTAAEVTDILYSSATDLGPDGWDNQYGIGEVNAAKAVELAKYGFFLSGDTALFTGGSMRLTSSSAGACTWTSSNESVATVSGGVVTGRFAGTADITATLSDTEYSVTRTVTVFDASITGASSIEVGSTGVVYVNISPSKGYTWSISGPNASIASTQGLSGDNGLIIKGVSAGTTSIVASYGNLTRSHTITVTPADVSKLSVSSIASQTYTGKGLTPKPTVKFNDSTLREGADYTLSYRNNTNVGTATVVITGKGNFNGTKSATFRIASKSLSGASISGIAAYQWYTGKAIAPNPTVKLGSATLRKGADYTVSYKNNVKVGTATVTIAGKGNYAGTKSVTFRILARPSWSGATSMPVNATATYGVSNGSIRVVSGGTVIGVNGRTVTAKRAGSAVLGLYDSAGRLYAKRTVSVYALSGNYVMQSSLSSRLVLDNEGASRRDGARMIVWTRNGGANQKFQFVAQRDGTYAIRCAHSGKYVDVDGASKANGRQVIQWRWNGGNNQRWRITVDANNRLTFVSKNSGKVLDINGARAVRGQNMIQWPSNNGLNQKWVLKRN